MRRSSEQGQALPLLTLVLVLAAAAAVLVAELGAAAIARARAQTAADAAALAGAADGEAAARSLATDNDAVVAEWHDDGRTVEVVVQAGPARAAAAAERAGAGVVDVAGGGDRAGLAPAMLAALARADQLLGRPVPVVSGYRAPAEQQALWDRRGTNPYPVAPPGSSLHEHGLAIDVPSPFVPILLQVATDAGLCQPLPVTDPIHFAPCHPSSPG